LQEGVIERIGSNKRITLDVRVLSSTNRDLGAGIRAGTFREDLYYRLNVFQIHLPPLRERQQDISHLAAFFLARFCQELGKPAPALEELERKLILRALSAADDNKAGAARLLGVSERTLWYKLKRYGL